MAKLKENSTILKSTGEEIIATEESVDRKLLTKASKTELPTKLSQLDKDINFDERYYTETEVNAKLDGKVDNSRVLTDVPLNAKFTDTIYTHPSTHPASMITESTTKRFVSDTEKANWNKKAEISDIPTKLGQLENDKNYVTQEELGNAGYGDMVKSVYDKNNDGIVDRAEIADSVPWNGITNKPSTFTPNTKSVNGLDMDNVTETGFYYGYTMENSNQKTISTFIVIKYSPDWITQIQYIPSSQSKVYIRSRYNGPTWSKWVQIAQLDDLPTKLSQLTKDINFDERYYTETEIDTKLAAKSDKTHDHNTQYEPKVHIGATPPSDDTVPWIDTSI